MSTRLGTIAVVLVTLSLGALALFALRDSRWESRLGPRRYTEDIAVGPIVPGGSVQQGFVSPGSWLAEIGVDVRTKAPEREPISLDFRLAEDGFDGTVVREGNVMVVADRPSQTVLWTFDPLPESAGRRYTLTAVLDPSVRYPVTFPVALTDPLDGTLRTNGRPTGDHVDLLLQFGRRAQGGAVLAALLQSGSLSALGFAVIVIMSGAGAWAIRARERFRQATQDSPPIATWMLWPPFAAIAVVAILRAFSTSPQPEATLTFWAFLSVATFAAGAASQVLPSRVMVAWRQLRGFPPETAQRASASQGWSFRSLPFRISVPIRVAAARERLVSGQAWGAAATMSAPPLRALSWLPSRAETLLGERLGQLLALGMLFGLAFLVRASALISSESTPWWGFGGGSDSEVYLRLAINLASGTPGALASTVTTMAGTAILVPFAAVAVNVLGAFPGLLVLGWIFVGLGSLASVFLALAVSTATKSKVAGVLAGMLLALTPLAIHFSLLMMSDGIGLALLTLSLWLFFAAQQSRSIRAAAIFGLAVGLLVTTRSTGWFFGGFWWVALFAILYAWQTRNRAVPTARRIAVAAAPALGLLAVLLLVEIGARVAGSPHYYATNRYDTLTSVLTEHGISHANPDWLLLIRQAIAISDVTSLSLLDFAANRIPHAGALVGFAWIAALTAWASRRQTGTLGGRWPLLAIPAFGVLTFALYDALPSERWILGHDLVAPGGENLLQRSLFLAALAVMLVVLFVKIPACRAVYLALILYATVASLGFFSITVINERHTLPLIVVFYFSIGAVVAQSFVALSSTRAPLRRIRRNGSQAVAGIVAIASLTIVIVMMVTSVQAAIQQMRETQSDGRVDARQLSELRSLVSANAVILTTGNVDPSEVARQSGRPVYYDALYSGAFLVRPEAGNANRIEMCLGGSAPDCPDLSSVLAMPNNVRPALLWYDSLATTSGTAAKIHSGSRVSALRASRLSAIAGSGDSGKSIIWEVHPTPGI